MLVCVLLGIAVRLHAVNDEREVHDSAKDKKSVISEIQLAKGMMNPQTSISS